MIIVSGLIADDPTRMLLEQLTRRGYPFIFLDALEYPRAVSIEQHCYADGSVDGHVEGPDGTAVELNEIVGVYMRCVDFRARDFLREYDESEQQIVLCERNLSQSFIFDDLPCVVVNRFTSQMSNSCKPYQAALATNYGFATPQTLITSDPDMVRSFLAGCDGSVIYKAMGGTRSIVDRFGPADLRRLGHLRSCPVMFQQFVPGPNIRVHVIGPTVFATRIEASAVDYRYSANRFEAITLPEDVERACVELTSDLDLAMSGIDLIENDGQHWFLEANPSPGYSYFEVNSGQAISGALAEFLQAGGVLT